MVRFGRRLAAARRIGGAIMAAGLLVGAPILATTGSANAAPDHRFHGGGFARPGFHGRGFAPRVWYGRAWYPGRYWRGYPAIFPGYGYYGAPFVRYYYPHYVYPTYVMPTAVYAMPPRPPMAPPPPRQARNFTVYFDFDHFDLTHDGRRVIDAAIAQARAGGPARIEIIGNTDLAGTNSYNDVLSRHRAETVRNYMVSHGVDAGEIDVAAHGKMDPVVHTADGVREPRNRRVEIVISPAGGRQRYSPPPATSMRSPPPYYDRPIAPANATMAPPPNGQPTNLLHNQ